VVGLRRPVWGILLLLVFVAPGVKAQDFSAQISNAEATVVRYQGDADNAAQARDLAAVEIGPLATEVGRRADASENAEGAIDALWKNYITDSVNLKKSEISLQNSIDDVADLLNSATGTRRDDLQRNLDALKRQQAPQAAARQQLDDSFDSNLQQTEATLKTARGDYYTVRSAYEGAEVIYRNRTDDYLQAALALENAREALANARDAAHTATGGDANPYLVRLKAQSENKVFYDKQWLSKQESLDVFIDALRGEEKFYRQTMADNEAERQALHQEMLVQGAEAIRLLESYQDAIWYKAGREFLIDLSESAYNIARNLPEMGPYAFPAEAASRLIQLGVGKLIPDTTQQQDPTVNWRARWVPPWKADIAATRGLESGVRTGLGQMTDAFVQKTISSALGGDRVLISGKFGQYRMMSVVRNYAMAPSGTFVPFWDVAPATFGKFRELSPKQLGARALFKGDEFKASLRKAGAGFVSGLASGLAVDYLKDINQVPEYDAWFRYAEAAANYQQLYHALAAANALRLVDRAGLASLQKEIERLQKERDQSAGLRVSTKPTDDVAAGDRVALELEFSTAMDQVTLKAGNEDVPLQPTASRKIWHGGFAAAGRASVHLFVSGNAVTGGKPLDAKPETASVPDNGADASHLLKLGGKPIAAKQFHTSSLVSVADAMSWRAGLNQVSLFTAYNKPFRPTSDEFLSAKWSWCKAQNTCSRPAGDPAKEPEILSGTWKFQDEARYFQFHTAYFSDNPALAGSVTAQGARFYVSWATGTGAHWQMNLDVQLYDLDGSVLADLVRRSPPPSPYHGNETPWTAAGHPFEAQRGTLNTDSWYPFVNFLGAYRNMLVGLSITGEAGKTNISEVATLAKTVLGHVITRVHQLRFEGDPPQTAQAGTPAPSAGTGTGTTTGGTGTTSSTGTAPTGGSTGTGTGGGASGGTSGTGSTSGGSAGSGTQSAALPPAGGNIPYTQLHVPMGTPDAAIAGTVLAYGPKDIEPATSVIAVRAGGEYFTAPQALADEYRRLTNAIGPYLARERERLDSHLDAAGLTQEASTLANMVRDNIRASQEVHDALGNQFSSFGRRYFAALETFARDRAASAAGDSSLSPWRDLADELAAVIARIQNHGQRHTKRGVHWLMTAHASGRFELDRIPLPGIGNVIAGIYDIRFGGEGYRNQRLAFSGDHWSSALSVETKAIAPIMALAPKVEGRLGALRVKLRPLSKGEKRLVDETPRSERWALVGAFEQKGRPGKGGFWARLLNQYRPPDQQTPRKQVPSPTTAGGALAPSMHPARENAQDLRRWMQRMMEAQQQMLQPLRQQPILPAPPSGQLPPGAFAPPQPVPLPPSPQIPFPAPPPQ